MKLTGKAKKKPPNKMEVSKNKKREG